ncbi:universal stress protein [Pseudonocardia sp. RS11V-5]|uniref:universal stress protein n=1 Tax=Pseudonocardia terrae TaxID=2905831 RepID=UPI001E632CC4|nr:universal stress protein [Pseudonocardia terrae]MCE3553149.1 universal stress protein [Pseudonocardia terrae]
MSRPGNGVVVAGIDGSDLAVEAARWAAAYAARHHCTLRLVRASQLPRSSPPEAMERIRHYAERQLWVAARLARGVAPEITVEQSFVEGDPIDVLATATDAARLMVMGTRGVGGFAGLLVGSTGDALARLARCPLVVVRGPVESDAALAHGGRVRPVVVGVDGSPAGEAALAFAFAEADAWSAPLVAVHSWLEYLEDPGGTTRSELSELEQEEREVLAERLAGWGAKYPGIRVSREVVNGPAAKALVARSVNARLVVVGSFGRGGLARLVLGSTSRALLHHAHSPVAVVRPDAAADHAEGHETR